ncbi:hypothetical protein [Aquimarina sp. 2201CG14-23]|uniref:hypothetical protein n=1 Tax=Aquimarina mycalae TaxID=3040073 RepID=UPI002477E060|nr:hypothetical protein [Aquimarina sp. 2201CG14-23]MDH7447380.1 hypothetical protein [Aquimarina sp. 2201CG14-23]
MKNLFWISLLFFTFSFGQNNFSDKDLISSYEDYAEMTREVAYIHLNKQTFIKGEMIAFNAYLLDKNTKKLSSATSNLYCIILDQNDVIIQSKLFAVTNGTAIGNFMIDDTFSAGEYTILAYTNWMRNFEEQNFFREKILILDSESKSPDSSSTINNSIDAQLLPEGGHILSETTNVIGVIVKSEDGNGIPFALCDIINSKNQNIASFTLNQFGIGRFSFIPMSQEKYKAVITHEGKKHTFPIENIEPKGISLSVQDQRNKVAFTFRTNANTLPSIKDKYYTLAIHNGNGLKEVDFSFENSTELIRVIPSEDLFSGINIFTVFDSKKNPILERLFFNYSGLSFLESKQISHKKENDSILITIKYDFTLSASENAMSLSVLPKKNKSNISNHNLASYTTLQPYVRGNIQNAHYYFSQITPRKKYDLDNLLITQGWSSYNWHTIFNNPPDYEYDFENGIQFMARNNKTKATTLLLYPNANNKSEIIRLNKDEVNFERNEFFPIDDEKIRFGEINAKNLLTKPNLSIQFNPKQIDNPNFKILKNTLNSPKQIEKEKNYTGFSGWQETEKLDEVIIIEKSKPTRIERIRNTTLGKVEEFDEDKKRYYRNFTNYIRSKGFRVEETTSEDPTSLSLSNFQIFNRSITSVSLTSAASSPNPISLSKDAPFAMTKNNVPLIYLDGVLLSDFEILRDFSLEQVDYIEINTNGLGGGIRSAGGIIKIVTDPFKVTKKVAYKTPYKEYEIPLTFSTPDRFYIPKYKSFQSDFFKEYGVIDWFPKLKIGIDGNIHFKILNTELLEIKLYIEGILNDGTFISEIKDINVE